MKSLISLLLIFIGSCTPSNMDLSEPASYAESPLNFAPDQKIHVEIEPQGEAAQVFYLINSRDLNAGIALRPIIHLQGTAKGAGKYLEREKNDKQHDNTARFTDILALPKANKIHLLSPRIPASSTHLTFEQNFSLDLLAGISYALVLNPSGRYDRAPLYLNWEQLPDNSELAFKIDEFGQFITGQIKYAGAKKDLWQVRIIQHNRLVSSVARVKKNGHFLVELARHPFLGDDALLTILIEPSDPDSPLPRFMKNFSIRELLEQPDLGLIELGRLSKPLTFNINIPGPGYIYLKGTVGMGETRVKKAIKASGPTIFEELYEGMYEIAVVPPVDSPWGMRVIENIDISGPEINLSLKWPKRQKLNAKIINHDNTAAVGAQIEFFRLGQMGSNGSEDIFSDQVFSFTATTNNEGQVCQRQFGISTAKHNECAGLALDDGRYIAHIIPPLGSHNAHQWQTFDFPRTKSLVISLEETRRLSGKIYGPDQITPIKQAYITIYAGNYKHSQPRVLANALTDATGTFYAFVPRTQKSH